MGTALFYFYDSSIHLGYGNYGYIQSFSPLVYMWKIITQCEKKYI